MQRKANICIPFACKLQTKVTYCKSLPLMNLAQIASISSVQDRSEQGIPVARVCTLICKLGADSGSWQDDNGAFSFIRESSGTKVASHARQTISLLGNPQLRSSPASST